MIHTVWFSKRSLLQNKEVWQTLSGQGFCPIIKSQETLSGSVDETTGYTLNTTIWLSVCMTESHSCLQGCYDVNESSIDFVCVCVLVVEEPDVPPSQRSGGSSADGCGPLLLHPWSGHSHDRNYPTGGAGCQWHCGDPCAQGMVTYHRTLMYMTTKISIDQWFSTSIPHVYRPETIFCDIAEH